jgi:hypothetical protein
VDYELGLGFVKDDLDGTKELFLVASPVPRGNDGGEDSNSAVVTTNHSDGNCPVIRFKEDRSSGLAEGYVQTPSEEKQVLQMLTEYPDVGSSTKKIFKITEIVDAYHFARDTVIEAVESGLVSLVKVDRHPWCNSFMLQMLTSLEALPGPEVVDAVCAFSEMNISIYNQAYHRIKEMCFAKDYHLVYHHHGEHLYLVAHPANGSLLDAGENGDDSNRIECPPLVFHDNGSASSDKGSKEMILVNEGSAFLAQEESFFFEGNRKYPLSILLDAFEQADVRDAGFEIVLNNCSTFILSMMRILGLEPNEAVVAYTAEKLVANNKTIKRLRESGNLSLLQQNKEVAALDEKTLIETLVKYYIDENYYGSSLSNVVPVDSNESPILSELHRDLQEASAPASAEPCTLCAGGAARDLAAQSRNAWVDGVGYLSCEEAEVLVQDFVVGSASCTLSQISGVAHCGCPELPPPTSEFSCDFCGTPDYNIDLNKIVPEFPPPRDREPFTCFDYILFASAYDLGGRECENLLGAQHFCGCPDFPKPPECPLCVDGSDVPNLELEVVPGATCRDLVDLLAQGITDQCGAIQATAGVYCGCQSNDPDGTNYNLRLRETPCRVCPNRGLLPDSSIAAEFLDVINGVLVPSFTSCGQIEFFANAYDLCDPDNTFFAASFCDCGRVDDQVPKCTLCANNGTISPDLARELLPVNSLSVAVTCASATDLIELPATELVECAVIQELGTLTCGCPTRPEPLNFTIDCPFPCSWDDIDPFQYDFLYTNLPCASIYVRSLHATSTEECEALQFVAPFCCEDAPLVQNGCTFCADGSVPAFTGYLEDFSIKLVTSGQEYYEDTPKLLSADDELCPKIQTFGYYLFGCPSLPPPIPGQVDCELLPDSCSVQDLSLGCASRYSLRSVTTNATQCQQDAVYFDLMCCQGNDRMGLIPPPPQTDLQLLPVTITVVPDSYFDQKAWAVLNDKREYVAYSPYFAESTTSITTIFLEGGKTYTFYILDEYGYGFDRTFGGYNVTLGTSPSGELLVDDDGFEDYYSISTFTLPIVAANAPSPRPTGFVPAATRPPATSPVSVPSPAAGGAGGGKKQRGMMSMIPSRRLHLFEPGR